MCWNGYRCGARAWARVAGRAVHSTGHHGKPPPATSQHITTPNYALLPYNGLPDARSGPDCIARASKPNDCNAGVGMNLEGLSDWARTWSFVGE